MINLIKDARIDKGYTQKRVADMLGISVEYYGNVEGGRYVPFSSGIGDRIAEVLDIDAEALALEFFKLSREARKKKNK